jgi:hypothetical protein
MPDPSQPLDEFELAIVGTNELPFLDEEIAEALDGAELVLSVGDVDLARIARLMPPETHCLYVLGDQDDPTLSSPPRCHQLTEKGALVFGWAIVGISGGSEFDDGDNVITEEEAERLVEAIETIPDYDILVTHAPPPTAEADTGEAPPLQALGTLYTVAVPLYHFYAHSTEGGNAEPVAGALAVGVNGVQRLRLRRPGN